MYYAQKERAQDKGIKEESVFTLQNFNYLTETFKKLETQGI